MTPEQDLQAMTGRREESQRPETYTLSRAISFGILGSLAGMLAMDLVMVAESLMIGEPATSYLALIGSVLGGDALVGVAMHLVMGSLLGLVFGVTVYYVEFLRIDTLWKGVWLGILAGLVTIPFGCVPFAILSGVPILFMVGFSFIPHLVWGVVLGLVVGLGLRSDRRSAEASTAN
jgi:ethanolamine transporter EutH